MDREAHLHRSSRDQLRQFCMTISVALTDNPTDGLTAELDSLFDDPRFHIVIPIVRDLSRLSLNGPPHTGTPPGYLGLGQV